MDIEPRASNCWRAFAVPFSATICSYLILAAGAQAAVAPTVGDVDQFLAKDAATATDATQVTQRCDGALALAQILRLSLETRRGPASVGGDFSAYESIADVLASTAAEMGTISDTNPQKPVRDAAQSCISRVAAARTDISLSRPLYDRLAAIPVAGLPKPTAYVLKKVLLQYRLGGVDQDAAGRAKVAGLKKEITDTGIVFDRNLAEIRGEITLKAADDLAGLPQDYIDAHKPAADGLIHITTNYPDAFPVMRFAKRVEVRKAMNIVFNNRAWPDNEAVLKHLLEKRYELARQLGFANYADLITADKMIGSGAHAATFLDEVNAAAAPAAERDLASLLTEERKIDPAATTVPEWDSGYLFNIVQKQRYDVDDAVVRQYFTYEKARAGIFQLAHDLFGADIRPWNTPVWDRSVSAWELYGRGRLVGRFYLDMSPRPGKFTHAETRTLHIGLAGRRTPVGLLICNFPATGPMSHDDVTTFLHEFGHLLHGLYAGHQQYVDQANGALERDFIEAPSQMLEEWTWDYDSLRGFAANPKGEPIPKDLVAKMNAGRHFGEANNWKAQIAYSAVSLNYHNRPADSFDLQQMYKAQWTKYASVPFVEGAHPYASFGHLNGYSATYYTYVWSEAIALDMLTRFKAAGIRDHKTAMAYRRAVLEPGASESASDLIQDFLGRPLSIAAFKAQLQNH